MLRVSLVKVQTFGNGTCFRHGTEGMHVKYLVEVRLPSRDDADGTLVAACWRRYREFQALQILLRGASGQELQLPKAPWLSSVDTELRRQQLEQCLRDYISASRSLPPQLLQWLEVPSPTGGMVVEHGQEEQTRSRDEPVGPAPSAPSKRRPKGGLDDLWRYMLLCVTAVLLVVALFTGEMRSFTLGALFSVTILGAASSSSSSAKAELQQSGDALLIEQSKASVIPRPQQQQQRQSEHVALRAEAAESSLLSEPSFAELPAELMQLTSSCLDALEHGCGETSCQGHPWELLTDSGGIKVWSAPLDGKDILMWKTRFRIRLHGGLRHVEDYILDWAKRQRSWDKGFVVGETIQTYAGNQDLVRYVHGRVGLIDRREFINLRGKRRHAEDAGFTCSGVSVDCDQLKEVPPATTDAVRASCGVGMGTVAKKVDLPGLATGETCWEITLISHVDPKGNLSVRVLNSAQTHVLKTSARNCIHFFQTHDFSRE